MKNLHFTLICLLVAFLLASCEQTEDDPSGSIGFSLDIRELSSPEARAAKTSSFFPRPQDIHSASFQVVGVNDTYNKTVKATQISDRRVAIDPIVLPFGEHKLTRFELLSESGTTLYACPDENASEQILSTVNNPLPLEFTISEEENVLQVEVVPVIDAFLDGFGYHLSSVVIKNSLLGFTLGVRQKDSLFADDGYYKLEVLRLEDSVMLYQEDSLPFGVRRFDIDLQGDATTVQLRVSSENYATQRYSFYSDHQNYYFEGVWLGYGFYGPNLDPINLLLDEESKNIHFSRYMAYIDKYPNPYPWPNNPPYNGPYTVNLIKQYQITHYEGHLYFNFQHTLDLSKMNSLKYAKSITFERCLYNTINAFPNLEEVNALTFNYAHGLTQIDGFDKLERVNSLCFTNNEHLTHIKGFDRFHRFERLSVVNCPSLHTIDAFRSLIGGESFKLISCDSLENLCPLRKKFNFYYSTIPRHGDNFKIENLKDGLSLSYLEFQSLSCN
ncbi:MAG: hypothetical protein MI784_16540 [Cytophagales bacterium]|nr:hypothetical protein [Cytophagales bacterium]